MTKNEPGKFTHFRVETMDKVTDTLVEALKNSMSQPGEIRLFRSGKLSGLFASRSSLNSEAAQKGLEQGFLEVVRTESKGKSTIEWVRITQAGIEFLLNYESPARVLEEMRRSLQGTRDGLPDWLTRLQQTIRDMNERVANEVDNMARQIDALQLRVTTALQRIEESSPKLPATTSSVVPWAQDALSYIDRRREGGVDANCPLPELFAALRRHSSELTVTEFHNGLKRLHDRGLLRLLPFESQNEMPEPEYALLDGTDVFYFVAQ